MIRERRVLGKPSTVGINQDLSKGGSGLLTRVGLGRGWWRWLHPDPMSRYDGDEVLDGGDPGSGPGRPRRLLFFGQRAHAAAQDHLAAVDLDGDAAGVQLGAALESLFDLGLELGRGDL